MQLNTAVAILTIQAIENPDEKIKCFQMIDILSKNSTEKTHFLNTDNWTQRFSPRGSELLLQLKEKGADISRFEVYLTRQKLNLYSNYKERSSADCKFLQNALKTEYGFEEIPANMMPVAQLEAIVGTLLAEEKLKNNTKTIFEFKNLNVINVI